LGAGLLAGALLITSIGPAVSSVSAQDRYVVERGDTLSQIAQNYGMTVRQLVWLNGIDDPDLIFPGQDLVLHASGSGVGIEESTSTAARHDASANASDEQANVTTDDAASGASAVADENTVTDDSESISQGGPQAYPPYFPSGQVRDLLIDAAHRYGWDPNLILAQAWQESTWRQDEVSWTGAIGVMQVMPQTAAEMESWYFRHDMNVWDSAYDNIEMGVAFLTVLYQETGSVELALASYYQGWASVQADGFFPDTHEYVDRIFMFQEQFANGELP
jgi:LysM repeat protein